jgi:hypothetical protein
VRAARAAAAGAVELALRVADQELRERLHADDVMEVAAGRARDRREEVQVHRVVPMRSVVTEMSVRARSSMSA